MSLNADIKHSLTPMTSNLGSKVRFAITSFCVGIALTLFVYWRALNYYQVRLGGLIAGPFACFFSADQDRFPYGLLGIGVVALLFVLGWRILGSGSYLLLLLAVLSWFFFGYAWEFRYL